MLRLYCHSMQAQSYLCVPKIFCIKTGLFFPLLAFNFHNLLDNSASHLTEIPLGEKAGR